MRPTKINWAVLDSYFDEDQEKNEVASTLSSIHVRERPVNPLEGEEEEGEHAPVGKKHKTSQLMALERAPDNIRIQEIEQHNHRDNKSAIFALNMSKGSSNMIINKPPQINVLEYCARYRNELPWFMTMQTFLAGASGNYDYPDVPVISRAMIQEFLRSAQNPGERPCINLDHEPCKGDHRTQCVSHRLSSRQAQGRGFKLREMLFGDTLTRVNEAIAKKKDFSTILDPVPDMCYLCHLWVALRDSTYQRDKKSDKVVLINRFMVIIDQIGEYDRSKMLMSDKVNSGIWGPFPLFNESNYIVDLKNSRIEESANLLFRLTRALLPPIDVTQQKTSIRSNHTNDLSLSGSQHL